MLHRPCEVKIDNNAQLGWSWSFSWSWQYINQIKQQPLTWAPQLLRNMWLNGNDWIKHKVKVNCLIWNPKHIFHSNLFLQSSVPIAKFSRTELALYWFITTPNQKSIELAWNEPTSWWLVMAIRWLISGCFRMLVLVDLEWRAMAGGIEPFRVVKRSW